MKPKSNMYDWITKTHNFIRGECPHRCSYCFVKSSRVAKLYAGEPRLIESQFKSLGKGHFYFIGSMIDMFAGDIPSEWIQRILDHCGKFDNQYLFQSKNPGRFIEDIFYYPENTILGTTIETNRKYKEMGLAPDVLDRAEYINMISRNFKTMVTIEPIFDFDIDDMFDLIKMCKPSWVNIGSDSKKHGLPEPSPDKIKALIDNLKYEGIEVKLKSNLNRILNK